MNKKRRKGGKKQSRKTNLPDEFLAQARQSNETIRADLVDLSQRWVKLGKACLEFKKQKYFRAITDPGTKKPFRTFTDWAKWISGKSRSSVFNIVRLVRQLENDVSEADLAATSKENAEALVEVKKRGRKITPEMVEAAKALPARKFRKQYIPDEAGDDSEAETQDVNDEERSGQHSHSGTTLGPFQVSNETGDVFQQALDMAIEEVGRDEDVRGDAAVDEALGKIASDFVSSREIEHVLGRKSPERVARQDAAEAEGEIA